MKPLHILLLSAVCLAAPLSQAEPDRLVRAMLGISSIPARFPPPAKGMDFCYLTFAKFKNGKFIGYGNLQPRIAVFSRGANTPTYDAELGWAKQDGKSGYCMTTQGWTTGFIPDDLFGHLAFTRYLALDESPTTTLGEFQVLGFAGGGDRVYSGTTPDAREFIKHTEYVVVFLMRTFSSREQAEAFAKSLPQLSLE